MSVFSDSVESDLDIFLNDDEFAVQADLGEGADPRYISVIMDMVPELVEGISSSVRTARRDAICKTSDLNGTSVGQHIFVDDVVSIHAPARGATA